MKNIDFENTTLADALRALHNYIFSVVDQHVDQKLSVQKEVDGNYPEKPLTSEEACKFLHVSKPILRQLVKDKVIKRHKLIGVRGYRYYASELITALRHE